MIMGKYGAVIGLKEPITWKFILVTYKHRRFSTNHSGAVFPPAHQSNHGISPNDSVNYSVNYSG
jgi:hypothetical protein